MTAVPVRVLALCAAAAACGGENPEEHHDEAPPPSNRIDVPHSVRQNLGIEFATVERRRVAATVRLPGQFELLPAARHEHRAMLPGRIEIEVVLLQRVAAGDLLCTLESPEWRARQRELGDLETQLELDGERLQALEPLLVAHERHEHSLRDAIAVLEKRIGELEVMRRDVGGQAGAIANANVSLAQLQAAAAEAAEQHSQTQTRLVELRAARRAGAERFELALQSAATVAGVSTEELRESWRRVDRISIRAAAPGVVDRIAIAAGGFAEVGDLLLTVTDPKRVRFRAHAPQSDLRRLRAGAGASVRPPQGGEPVRGELQIGIDVDERTRMVELLLDASPAPDWAHPGLAGFLEVVTDSTAEAELAIPRRAVQRDGLDRVFFRRDSKNPDRVVRIEGDFGVDDGEWIVVKSDLADGDEVVVSGAYQLMLASSDSAQKGGHFHPDGSWHADSDH
ncbi:MAG: efflux RND transporter periplasmic adaptor subunit [Planctomycetes bacterium]|nr:efflux RND transporter periplasmic adaptor subunit [Planctomycetota bacterium]